MADRPNSGGACSVGERCIDTCTTRGEPAGVGLVGGESPSEGGSVPKRRRIWVKTYDPDAGNGGRTGIKRGRGQENSRFPSSRLGGRSADPVGDVLVASGSRGRVSGSCREDGSGSEEPPSPGILDVMMGYIGRVRLGRLRCVL